ncbi:MAG: glycosyltransferase family 39 protein, partial [Bdellovibrionales bacterium]|nr:glycosyltransferase family 39 protein [Bdellovibrionales bacterium]
MTAPTTPKLERCVLATLLALITLHTYFRLSRSLWLDELLTAWITKETFPTAFLLPWNYQGQSPVAFVVVWLTRQLLGSSELVLRLPSFLLSILTLLAVYKIGMILWQKQIGIRAALLCCVVTPLTISLDARPYAMALCAYGWSLYFFILWLKNPTERLLGTTTLLALATLYSHPLFALAYVPFLLGALWVAPHRKFSLIAWLGIGLLALMPLAHQLLALSAKQPVYTWLPTLSWGRIYLSLCPFPVIGLLIVFTASFYLGVQEGEKPIKEPMLKLLPALYLTPLLLAFILDYFDLLRIFTPRYVLYSYIPLCLLLAWLSHVLRPLMFYG